MNTGGSLGRIAIKKKGTANWSEEEINRMLLCLLENKCMKQNSGGLEVDETKEVKQNKGVGAFKGVIRD